MKASAWSLKRLAWAYGCAKTGSAEEAQLEEELVRRIRNDEWPLKPGETVGDFFARTGTVP